MWSQNQTQTLGRNRPLPAGRPEAQVAERVGRTTSHRPQMSSGRLFLDRVGRHQSPSPLHRHPQNNMAFSKTRAKGDVSTLPARGHFYFALTVSRRVCAQGTTQGAFRASTSAIGTNFPCVGTAERMPDNRRASDAGPRTHVHRDSPEVRNETSLASTSGPAVMRCPPLGSNWSKSANTSANKKTRMDPTDSSELFIKARFSATPRLLASRLP
jgi:hypothetical protein